MFEPVIGRSVEGTTDTPVILQIDPHATSESHKDARLPGATTVGAEAATACRVGRDAAPVREVRTVAALRRAVESLPAYFGPG